MIEPICEVAEVVPKGSSQLFLVCSVGLESSAEMSKQLGHEGESHAAADACLGFESEVSGLAGLLYSLGKPLLQFVQMNFVNVDGVIHELSHQPAGEVQKNILVSKIVDVKLPSRIGKHHVIEVAIMKFVADAPELDALSGASVPAIEEVAVARSRQSAPATVAAKSTAKVGKAVFASRTLGVHPSWVSIAVKVLIELQALIDLPDVARRLPRRCHSDSLRSATLLPVFTGRVAASMSRGSETASGRLVREWRSARGRSVDSHRLRSHGVSVLAPRVLSAACSSGSACQMVATSPWCRSYRSGHTSETLPRVPAESATAKAHGASAIAKRPASSGAKLAPVATISSTRS